MSNYIQVLRKLEQERPSTPAPPARLERSRPEAESPRLDSAPAAPPVPVAQGRSASNAHDRALAAACAPLLERIRAMAVEGTALRTLVFASLSDSGAARDVAAGLAARGEELGLAVALGSLARIGGRPFLTERRGRVDEEAARQGVDLDAPSRAASVERWLERFPSAQLVAIDGPPLDSSVDSMLLAAACDGLVIAAEAGVTERAALGRAVERARAAGSAVHGVVLLRRTRG